MTDQTTAPLGDLSLRFRAMATDVNVRICGPVAGAEAALERAQDVFRRVEAACTRFKDDSPLMLANAAGEEWYDVPQECFAAVSEAARAHRETDGLFDPRVLRTLQQLGYDRSLPFLEGVETDGSAPAGPVGPGPWEPGLDPDRPAVRIGPVPIDLGGIGKGLAVRWAAQELIGVGVASLVEAGGDLHAAGPGPELQGWNVGVEDPTGAEEHVAVLNVRDLACATSSIRIRKWQAGGKTVHHLIDPRTGEAGGGTLLAVTVVGPDAAWAEVWSKTLFLAGRDGIRAFAEQRDLAALWVDKHGIVGMTGRMRPYVIWQLGGR